MVPITDADREALVALIESYGDKALRAVGLAHRDIPAEEAANIKTALLSAEDLDHDLVLDAIVVSCAVLSDPLCMITASITA